MFFSICGSAMAQTDSTEAQSQKNLRVVPFPNLANNQVFGWGGGINVALLYQLNKNDSLSPVSMTVVQPMYFENHTWWVGLFQQYYWNQDKWRGSLLAFTANVNFQFSTESYLPNIDPVFISYNATQTNFSPEIMRRVAKHTYLGAHYRFSINEVTFPDNPIFEDLVSKVYDKQHIESGLGVAALYDNRDNVMDATSGYYGYFNSYSYFDLIGSQVNYTFFQSEISAYYRLNPKMVLANKATLQVNVGDAPFIDQNIMGFAGRFQSDLRGYNQGEFRGDQLYCVQSELRWNVYKKWSVNLYAGAGTVFSEGTDKPFLPAGGAGFRYMAAEQYRVKVGIDYARGKNDHGIYFLIGEQF